MSIFKDQAGGSFDLKDLDKLLKRIIDLCLLAFSIFALPIVVISLNEARETGMNFDKVLQVVSIIVAFVLLILRNRISTTSKLLVILSFSVLAAFTNLATVGVLSDGPLLLFFVVGLIATTLDLKYSIVALVIVSIGYFIIGSLFVSGYLSNDIDLNENQLEISGWISDVLVFLLISGVLVFAITKGKSKLFEYIKEISKINMELSISRDKALAAQKAKNEFLDNISHEIRTPLNHIGGYVELLKPYVNKDLTAEYLDKISNSSEKLLDMVNTILDLSDMEKGNFETNFDYFNFHQFIYEISGMYRKQAEEKNLQFSITSSEEMNTEIYMDKARLSIALVPLMENAVKFTKEGSISIVVNKYKSKSYEAINLEIVITDTGIGMDPEFIESSTDYFTQQDGSTLREYEGIGIGLALSKKVIDKLGGHMEIESEKGKGTTITIFLNEIKTKADDPLKDKNGSFLHLMKYSKPVLPDEIRNLLLEEANNMWVELNTRQPLEKVVEFGLLLKEQGTKSKVKEVAEYGASIIKAAEDYDIDKVLNLLKLYPKLLVKLRLK